jgi:hypothetical protein
MKRVIATLALTVAGFAGLTTESNACPPAPCGHSSGGYYVVYVYRSYCPDRYGYGYDDDMPFRTPGQPGQSAPSFNGNGSRTQTSNFGPSGSGSSVIPNGLSSTFSGGTGSNVAGPNGSGPAISSSGSVGRPGGGVLPNGGGSSVSVGPNGTNAQPFIAPNTGRPGGGIIPNGGSGNVAINPGGKTAQFDLVGPTSGGRSGGGIIPNGGSSGISINPTGKTPQQFIAPPAAGNKAPVTKSRR